MSPYHLVAILCWAALPSISAGAHCPADGNSEKELLHFSFITAINGSSSSSGGIPIVDYALEQINNDSRVLPNYTLCHTEVLNSQCKSISALESFLGHFDNQTQPTYVSVMCCGCSSATIPVAEISHHWNIPHISFASSAPTLNNRERFKKFFRTLPCHVYVPPSIAAMMKEFNWRQMAIITQNESPFTASADAMKLIFDEQNWRLDQTSKIDPNDDSVDYESLFTWEEDYRIIMVNTFESHAYHIVCEAYRKYKERLLHQEIVLILHGRYPKEWWETAFKKVGNTSRCSRGEVMKALNKTLAITPLTYNLVDDPDARAYSNSSSSEIELKYKQLMNLPENSNYTPLNFYGNAYDAMWAMAIGLDNADRRAKAGDDSGCKDLQGELVPLNMFNYTNNKMGCMMKNGYAAVNFTGITGNIMFQPDGARPENVMRLKQTRVFQQGDNTYSVTRPTVAKIINEENYEWGVVKFGDGKIVFEGNESDTIWPDGNPPYDGSPERVVETTPLALTIVYYTLATVGLVFTTMCLSFNIIFRNKPVVKLASPNLNCLITVGAAMLYISIYFYSYSATVEYQATILCNFRFWLFAIGYTTCYSVILSKQWRVYHIFSNPKPSQRIIKDWLLFMIVGTLVGVDAIILLVGTAVPTSRLEAMKMEKDGIYISKDGKNEIIEFYTCTNQDTIIWTSVSFAYKALMQLFGIFMAFSTRNVHIKALNDTTANYAIIYINSITLTLLIVTEYALESHPRAYTALYGLAILVEATLFVGLVFIPKAVLLHIDPDGNKTVFMTSKHQTAASINNTLDTEKLTVSDVKGKIVDLQKVLVQLEKSESAAVAENGRV